MYSAPHQPRESETLMTTPPPAKDDLAVNRHIGRRTVLTAAALTAPAIALSVATPARAASAGSTIRVDGPTEAAVGDVLTGTITATITSANGVPLPGETVTFTLAPTTLGTFPGGTTTATTTTNAAGQATAPDLTLTRTGALTITATNSGHTATISIPIADNAATGAIAFSAPAYATTPGGVIENISGTVTLTAGTLPSSIKFDVPQGWSGPDTASVTPVTQERGTFSTGPFKPSASAPTRAEITATSSAPGIKAATADLAIASEFAAAFSVGGYVLFDAFLPVSPKAITAYGSAPVFFTEAGPGGGYTFDDFQHLSFSFGDVTTATSEDGRQFGVAITGRFISLVAPENAGVLTIDQKANPEGGFRLSLSSVGPLGFDGLSSLQGKWNPARLIVSSIYPAYLQPAS